MAFDIEKLKAGFPKELQKVVEVVPIHQVIDPYHERLPTGVMSLDRALIGGIPGGTITQIFGPDGVGKDYLSQLIMASAQQQYGEEFNMFYVTFGYYPDKKFMRFSGVQLPFSDVELARQGIDPSKATVEQRGKQIGNILFIDIRQIGSDKPAEYLMQTVLELVKSGDFHLGVINELASGETGSGVKKTLYENERVAAWPTLMSGFCRKFYSAVRYHQKEGSLPNSTRLLFLNPVRENIDMFSFEKFSQPGGRAQKHAKVIDIHLSPKKRKKKGTVQIGKYVKWRIAKGKLGIHEGDEGEWLFMFDKGIDLEEDLLRCAKAEGLVKAGKLYTIHDVDEKIAGGAEAVIELLKTNPEIERNLRDATLASVRKGRKEAASPIGEEDEEE